MTGETRAGGACTSCTEDIQWMLTIIAAKTVDRLLITSGMNTEKEFAWGKSAYRFCSHAPG